MFKISILNLGMGHMGYFLQRNFFSWTKGENVSWCEASRGILRGPEEPWKPGIKSTWQNCDGIVPTIQNGTFKLRGFPVGAPVFHPGLCAPTVISFFKNMWAAILW